MNKNQHYHWPKPYNPKEWNPQTKNLIPFISCTRRLKEKKYTSAGWKSFLFKTKTPQRKGLMTQVLNTWSLSCGDTHSTDKLSCVQTQGQMSFRHTLPPWRLSNRLVIHHLCYHIDISTTFQKCLHFMSSLSTRVTGQNVKYILGVSIAWVISRSQKLINIKWNNVLGLVRQLDALGCPYKLFSN